MLGKLLGKQSKKSGYYLELSEEEISATPEPPKVTEKSVTAPAPVEENGSVSAPAEPPVAGAAAPAKPVAAAPAAAPVAAPAASTSMSDPLEIIRTALAASANQSATSEPASEPTFATDYLVPKATARRRRPGACMSSFKSMAKDMKRSKSGI